MSLAASDNQLHKCVSIFLFNSALEDQKYRKKFSTYTSKLSFKTVTSITGDPSPFHNFKRKFNLGFNFVISMTIKNCNICLINLIQGIYSDIHHERRLGCQWWHRPLKMATLCSVAFHNIPIPSKYQISKCFHFSLSNRGRKACL